MADIDSHSSNLEDSNAIRFEATRLRSQNQNVLTELQRSGIDLDFSEPYNAYLIQSLVDLELITDIQGWKIVLGWQKHLGGILTSTLNKVRKQEKAARLREKLWRPGDPGVPPNGAPRPAH